MTNHRSDMDKLWVWQIAGRSADRIIRAVFKWRDVSIREYLYYTNFTFIMSIYHDTTSSWGIL